jgi:peptide/nickel transport system substrate-binding protein
MSSLTGLAISGKNIICALILFSLFSCRGDRPAMTTDLRIRLNKEPELLNPLNKAQPIAREVNQYMFLPLADIDPTTYEMTPILIKEIPRASIITNGPRKGQTSYTFEILDDAAWEDGKSITSADYLFTLKAIMHPNTDAKAYRSFLENIHDVEVYAENPKKVTVFHNKFYMYNDVLAINFEVYPKHIYDPKNALDAVSLKDLKDTTMFKQLIEKDSSILNFATEFNNHKYGKEIVTGSGPYQFKSWYPGQQIVLEKKKNYWAKNTTNPYLMASADRLIFHIIPDETAALTALKAGELDYLSLANGVEFQKLKEDDVFKDKFNYYSPRVIKNLYLMLNTKDVKLSSAKTRKALAHLTDVERYIETFEGGMGERTVGPVNPVKRYYNKNLKPVVFDVDITKTLLAEDGWKDSDRNGILDKIIGGKKVELKLDAYASGETGKNILLLLQDAAKQVGIDINAMMKEQKIVTKEHIEKGNYHIFVGQVSQEVLDDDFEPTYHSKNVNKGKNYSGISNKELDRQIEMVQTTSDLKARDAAYMRIQEILYEQQPYIYLYVPQEKMITSKKWKAFTSSKRPGYMANAFAIVPDYSEVNAN